MGLPEARETHSGDDSCLSEVAGLRSSERAKLRDEPLSWTCAESAFILLRVCA